MEVLRSRRYLPLLAKGITEFTVGVKTKKAQAFVYFSRCLAFVYRLPPLPPAAESHRFTCWVNLVWTCSFVGSRVRYVGGNRWRQKILRLSMKVLIISSKTFVFVNKSPLEATTKAQGWFPENMCEPRMQEDLHIDDVLYRNPFGCDLGSSWQCHWHV